MKQGRSVQQLAAEIVRQRDRRRDFVADTRHMTFTPEAHLDLDRIEAVADAPLTAVAHHQVPQKLEIPKRFYARLLEKLKGRAIELPRGGWSRMIQEAEAA